MRRWDYQATTRLDDGSSRGLAGSLWTDDPDPMPEFQRMLAKRAHDLGIWHGGMVVLRSGNERKMGAIWTSPKVR